MSTNKKQRRNSLVEKQRAIIERSHSEGRNGNLNSSEEADYQRIESQLKECEANLKRELEIFNRELSLQNRVPADSISLYGGSASNSTSQSGWADVRTGERIHLLRPEQRMSDYVDSRLPAGMKSTDLDFGRFVRAVVSGNWRGAEAEARAMNEAIPAAGAVLVPTALSTQIIDLARAGSAAVQLGAGTIPLTTSQTTFAKVEADPTPVWHAESANITPSDPTFGAFVLTAKTLAVLTSASVELVEDAPNAGETIQNTLAAAISGEMDRCAMYGNGVGEPQGILSNNQTQTYSMGANGANLTSYAPFGQSVKKILDYNGRPNGCILSPRTWLAIDTLTDNDANPLRPSQSYTDLQKVVSSRVSIARTQGNNNTCSDIFVGDFSQMIFGIRTQLNLEVSRVAGNSFSQLTVAFRGYARLDLLLRQPKHFCTVLGIY